MIELHQREWVAVCRFGGVGDNLIAASVLHGLAKKNKRVDMITNKHAAAVFENNPLIDKLSICQDGDQPAGCGLEWQQWFEKRSHEYPGGLFHLSHTIETTLAFVEAQTAFWWPASVRRKIADKSYLELAADICDIPYEFGRLFYPTQDEVLKAANTKAKMGDKVIGWALCGSRFDKVHPYSAWIIARLIKETGAAVMMCGRPGQDYEVAKIIQRDVEKQNGSLNGLHLAMTVQASADGPAADWPLRRSLTQLQNCDLVIGPDTGLMWGVAMDCIPKIMLLSHASETNITKHWVNTVSLHADPARVPCWPCHRLHDNPRTCVANKDNTGVACISDIDAETIISTAKGLLA